MKVIDAFIWSGSAREYDLLELRARTLGEAVDAQVAIRATLSHQGEPAPWDGMPEWPDGTPMVKWQCLTEVTSIPDGSRGGVYSPHAFHIEAQHRNAAVFAVHSLKGWRGSGIGGDPDDVVLVSDLDEIPDPATLERIVEGVELCGEVSVPMRMHGFALDYL